jgi:hypothetical protein
MTLTEFLLARYVEAEAGAKDVRRTVSFIAGDGCMSVGFEPMEAEVLADVEAKRRIIDHHHIEWKASRGGGWFCWRCGGNDADLYERFPTETEACPDLAALALPYVDHPDYNEAWRP